ncbi:hypothetical protein AZL_b05380 (plasmid) [Azospirillum sp. B510]|uniref:hypothetical protein n=1 Tax=Azospirillum sp. (strain B510) TaxID=137722 RepID=UPI0001C4C94B|nr:hypothetical protein [Azospirillum sp. B510]BAI75201.1 hypothetical protein AZL_b05380 [Azospirillum sp. B510]
MADASPSSTITLNFDIKPFTVTVTGAAASVVLQTTNQTAGSAQGQAAPAAGGTGQDKKPFFQGELEKAQQTQDALLNGYNLSIGQQVQLKFSDGIKEFVDNWKSGVLSVINKQATIGTAFDKLVVGMRKKLRDFFVNWASEQVAVGALDLLGINMKPKDPAQAAKQATAQTGGNATSSTNAGTAGGSSPNQATNTATSPTASSETGFLDALLSNLRPDSLLGTITSKLSSLFKRDGFLDSLMSGISGLFSSLFGKNGLAGGILSGISSVISWIFHSGGVIGETSRPGRTLSAGLFTGAPRFHSGGLVAGEVPIIARKGEAVFTPEQMTNADRLIQAAQDGGRAVNQSVTVNVAGGSTGDREQDKALAERIGASVREQLRAMMGNELRQQMRPGGMLNNMSYGG